MDYESLVNRVGLITTVHAKSSGQELELHPFQKCKVLKQTEKMNLTAHNFLHIVIEVGGVSDVSTFKQESMVW